MVPEGWKRLLLDQVCTKIAVGLAISVTPFMREAGVKLIRNQNIKRNIFDDTSIVYVSPEFAEKNKSKMVMARDVIAVRTGSNIGEACVVPRDFENSLTFTTLIARPDPRYLDSFYLSTHLNSDIGLSEVNRLMAGGGKPNLNSGELKKYELLAPPLAEQKKIAKILNAWDLAIATTEQLLKNGRRQKKALMQQLLTEKKRFPVFSESWKYKLIGQLVSESRLPSKNNNAEKRITVRLNLKGIEQRDFRGTESTESTAFFVRKAGQFIYGKQNFHKGAFGIIPKELDGFESSQDIPCFDFSGMCNPAWFYYFCSQEWFYAGLKDLMSGTGSKRLSPKTFLKLKIQCPSIEEQLKIAKVLATADQEIQALQAKLACLKREKKSLMQQLLTGKRRVKVDKLEVA